MVGALYSPFASASKEIVSNHVALFCDSESGFVLGDDTDGVAGGTDVRWVRFELRDVPGALNELALLDLDADGMTFLLFSFVGFQQFGDRCSTWGTPPPCFSVGSDSTRVSAGRIRKYEI